MRVPDFTERLLAYHTRFERQLLIHRLHRKERIRALGAPSGGASTAPERDDASSRPPEHRAPHSPWH